MKKLTHVNAYLPEEDAYIKEHIMEQDYKQLAENLSVMFGRHRTERNVCQHCNRVLDISRGLKFTQEEDDYIRAHIHEQTHKELAENMTKIFGVQRDAPSIRQRCSRLKIRRDEHYFTDEEKQFIAENAPHMSLKELHKAYNARFNKDRSERSLYDLGKKLGVKRTKETISRIYANNGKNREAEEGSLLVKEGRVRIKVKGKRNWQLRARVVWEEHYGKIPKTHVIVHLDGDSMNDDIHNLACVPRRYCGLIARAFNGFSTDRALNEVKIKYCELRDLLSGR